MLARKKARASRRRHASHLLDCQLRFQTDDVRQSLGEKMADLGVHRWNGSEDETANGEQHGFEDAGDLEDLRAETVVVGHVFQQARSAHLFLTQAEAQMVVLRVQVEVAHHQAEACEATPAGEIESPVEDFGNHKVRVAEVVYAGSGEDDSEVGG
jgi:hypothetical protein